MNKGEKEIMEAFFTLPQETKDKVIEIGQMIEKVHGQKFKTHELVFIVLNHYCDTIFGEIESDG